MESAWDLIIVGAGLAGSSSAWHLSRRLRGRVLLLEREPLAGTQATAQNAAMIRALPGVAGLARFTEAGQAFWNNLPEELGIPYAFRPVGSLLLASDPATLAALDTEVAQARLRGLDCRMVSPDELRASYPLLRECPMLGAAATVGDGIADPSALNEAWLSGARSRGVRVDLGRGVQRLSFESGRLDGVLLEDGETLHASTVLVAAGAWAGRMLTDSGLSDHALRPHRRHLFCTIEDSRIPEDHPFVWHLDLQAYFRPESGGFLFSACDQTEVAPGPAETAPGIEEFAHERLQSVFPFLSEIPLKSHWAGLRTFRPGAQFLLGPDRETPGLLHASGLGGHGVTCAPEIGRRLAEAWRKTGDRDLSPA
jgi:D-arginine dehydrogenase